MYEIDVLDSSNIFPHFLELVAPYFPIRNFAINNRIGTLNVTFKQNSDEPLIHIYILSVHSYDTYKNTGRARLIQFLDKHQGKQTLVVYFPSLLKVDEKVNKSFNQTIELIQADLLQLKNYPKEKVQKIIFFDHMKELNKENCLRDFMNCIKAYIAGLLEMELRHLDEQMEEMHLITNEKEFSYYKLFALKEKKAQIYMKLNLKQDALEIYSQFENYFMNEYPKSTHQVFNMIHPFDFLSKKTIESNQRNFLNSGDESQSTVLDFLVLIQFKILDLLSIMNQISCLERILDFSTQTELIVKLQIDKIKGKNQFLQEEEQLWQIGLLIWQYHNINQSLIVQAQVPQNMVDSNLIIFQMQQFKVRNKLLSIAESIGETLYGIEFSRLKVIPITEQCAVLESEILGESRDNLPEYPADLIKTFLLSDTKLRGVINDRRNFVQFYNNCFQEVIDSCNNLNIQRCRFEQLFNLLKVKNYYPQLALHQQSIDSVINEKGPELKFLNASFLVQKLILMHREHMQISFQECFNEILVSELPGNCFNKLFKILHQTLHLTKLKFVYFGYFEQLNIVNRVSYTEFQFKIAILKFLAVECDGKIEITMKSRDKDKKKIKLTCEGVEFRDQKKSSFTFNCDLNGLGNCYLIQKATLISGPFKLYFDVSQKLLQQKYYLMYPQIELEQISEISNVGTPIKLDIYDLNQTEVIIELITPLKINSTLLGLDNVTIEEIENGKFIVKSEKFHLIQQFQLILIGLIDSPSLTFRIQLTANKQLYQYDTKLAIVKNIRILDLSDLVDEDLELYEISSSSSKQFQIKNSFLLNDGDTVRQITNKGQQLLISQVNESEKQFPPHWTSIQNLLQFEKNVLDLKKLQNKLPLFKIQIIAVFQQEHSIPYKQPEYFHLIMKIQYLGNDDSQYQFDLRSYSVKGDRTFNEQFSPQKTIYVKNYQCFLTNSLDFEKPLVQVSSENGVIVQTEVEFQLEVNDQ